jgi:hypothetical protein
MREGMAVLHIKRSVSTPALFIKLSAPSARRAAAFAPTWRAKPASPPPRLRGASEGGRLEVDGVGAMTAWLERSVESFVRKTKA